MCVSVDWSVEISSKFLEKNIKKIGRVDHQQVGFLQKQNLGNGISNESAWSALIFPEVSARNIQPSVATSQIIKSSHDLLPTAEENHFTHIMYTVKATT